VEQHPEELQALLQDLLIGVTNFFRDPDAFAVLEREIVPRIFERAAQADPIRVWSVGCATGEEAYSLAMLLDERNAMAATSRSISVFATDIDEEAISNARRGLYPQSIEVDVTPARLRQHFVKEDQHNRIKKAIRETVMFAVHNILHDSAFSRLHLISCRNLLIYLNRDIQQKVFEMLHYALLPGGYLFLGASESADAVSDFFVPVDKKHRIYQVSSAKSSILRAIPEPMPVPRKKRPMQSPVHEPELGKATMVQPSWRLLEEYGMPGVFIDADNDVLYFTLQAGTFLHFPGGQPSHNILGLIHPDLHLELHAALFQARQSRQPVATRYLPWHKEGKNTAVRMLIRPAQAEHPAGDVTLLLFEEEKDIDLQGTGAVNDPEQAAVLRLEQELQHTKAQLQTVIEQYEVTLEDAKAANEEMQAINEELRSATEELETSKEELQSINEELVTVNSQLKLKVEETSQANDDLQNFVAATDIATIVIDRVVHIQRYTKPCTRLFNVIATDVGRPLLDITHRLEYPDLTTDIERVFDRLQPIEREVCSKDGHWYIARLLPYRTAQDHIAGLVLTFIDISQRKAAEERLFRSEQRLRRIAASTKDYAIVAMDPNGVVTTWNNGAERVFGYAEEEIIGQSAILLFTLEDRATGMFQEELRRAQQDGRAEDDRWHLRKDGALIFCSGITSPLTEDGLHGYVKICRDMTGSKWMQDHQSARLEWEKRERVRAEEATRLRDEFFAVLSHELKQPLNLIHLTAEMLSRQPETATLPAIVRGTDTIKRMVDSQAKIIDDLMDLSRLHTGKLTLARTQVNFSEAVARMVNLLMSEARQKKISLSLEPASKDQMVLGDAVRLEQIVWNLLSNALKFTPAGGRIQVGLCQEEETVCLEVADTGKGIAPEFAPFIFDMFRQADSGTARQYGGMGIGLALVKELVHSHGGRVEAHSQGLGQGSQFKVFLPVMASQINVSQPQVAGKSHLTDKRILLVDDAMDMLEALGELLALEGAQVSTAASGMDAIRVAQEAREPFHLIISDIGMPGMDGYALLRQLRTLSATATTPAIALSGFTRPKDVDRALEAGYESHVRKPLSLEQLIAQACRISR
jgi:two-component system CheB/CheR fusion protein